VDVLEEALLFVSECWRWRDLVVTLFLFLNVLVGFA